MKPLSAKQYGQAVRFIVENAGNRNFQNLETLAEELIKAGSQIRPLNTTLTNENQ